jgi:ABC-type branched-subunit amino acid transport system ATPase component
MVRTFQLTKALSRLTVIENIIVVHEWILVADLRHPTRRPGPGQLCARTAVH